MPEERKDSELNCIDEDLNQSLVTQIDLVERLVELFENKDIFDAFEEHLIKSVERSMRQINTIQNQITEKIKNPK